MKFGLFLIESPHRAHVGPSGRRADPGQGAALTSPEYLGGLARFAEEVGFDFVSFPEHVVLPVDYESRYPYQQYEGGDFKRYPYDETAFPEPITALTFVAAVTERLELGTSVLILPQRNPVILAKQLATLDALSRGRVSLTAGIGWFREEFEAIGVPWERRGRRADEYIQALRTLWRDEISTFHGETVSFERIRCLPKPTRPEGPPIYVGGHSLAAARRAGRLGDGFMPLGFGGFDGEDVGPLLDAWREAAAAAGRDAASMELWMGSAPDLESVRRVAERGASRVHFAFSAPDLDQAKRELEQIANEVIERF